VTGISGSGKSVALHALEDAGFFCVDNLPPELLRDFLRLEGERTDRRIAIAVDVRSAGSLPHLLPLLEQLRSEGVAVQTIFLDATTGALVRRFSETRRAHPLAERGALVEAIELERQLLAELRELSTVIDTSQLRPLTGRDAPVAAYLAAQPEVAEMLAQIESFLRRWLPAFEADQRSYLTVAIGCTGGQHRSVWFAERLAEAFGARAATLVRHRELDLTP